MRFNYNDGGRAAAGFKGSAGDCVARAVAIATEQPYQQVYDALAQIEGSLRRSKHHPRGRARSARNGVCTGAKAFKDYMAALGWKWTPTMEIGTGCRVHLTDGELPMGRLIVSVSRHYTAVIDGVIQDTYNPQREVTTFRQFPGWQTVDLKPGERRNENGIFTTARRCVYGYWSPALS